MELLELLAACIEDGRTAIAPTLVDPIEHERLDRLQRLGAMTRMPADAIFCPDCETRLVRVIAAGSGYCFDCGLVSLTPNETERLSPDGDWLRRRMAQALGLTGESSWVTVPDRVWRLGDVGRADRRHRVLFGQQLAHVSVQRALLAVWPSHVGNIPTILITTSAVEWVFLPGIRVRLVPLAAAFRVRGDGLVADEAVWASVQTVQSTIANRTRVGPFAEDFSDVLLPGETEPIPLTRSQAAILRVLWAQEGVSIGGPLLLRKAELEIEKPIDAFQLSKYPEANRAYHALVHSDRRGRYRLLREASDDQR